MLKRLVKSSKSLRWIFGILTSFNQFILNHRSRQRRFINPESVFELAKPLPRSFLGGGLDNNFFGLRHGLNSILRPTNFFNVYIEHGLFLGDFIKPESFLFDAVVTQSKYREDILVKKGISNIKVVGCYIQYFPKLKINNWKEGYILIIPSHSTDAVKADFNQKELIRKTLEIAKTEKIKEIVVCLFYKDVTPDIVNEYRRYGFKVVTAGHRYDRFFMNRLHTFLAYSNIVVTNDIGSHIGYSLFLNKRIKYVEIEVSYNPNDESKFIREINQRNNYEWESYKIIKNEIIVELNTRYCNNQHPTSVCDYVYGLRY